MNETPVVCQDRIIVSTRYQVLCFSLPNLDLLWSHRFKQHCSLAKCSVSERTLYLLRWNEILKIDVSTGQILLKRKYRIKWFDSALQVFRGRYFAATSNSKIVELDAQTLDIVREYKYSGGWAIASTPYLYGNLMISSSYASEIIAFNLDTNLPEWKMKKKAGAKPLQHFSQDCALIYDGHIDTRLQKIRLDGKRLWSVPLERVQALHILNEVEFLAVYKSAVDIYSLGLFDYRTGKLIQNLAEYALPDRSLYSYDLWDGVSIVENETHIVSNFKPGELTLIRK